MELDTTTGQLRERDFRCAVNHAITASCYYCRFFSLCTYVKNNNNKKNTNVGLFQRKDASKEKVGTRTNGLLLDMLFQCVFSSIITLPCELMLPCNKSEWQDVCLAHMPGFRKSPDSRIPPAPIGKAFPFVVAWSHAHVASRLKCWNCRCRGVAQQGACWEGGFVYCQPGMMSVSSISAGPLRCGAGLGPRCNTSLECGAGLGHMEVSHAVAVGSILPKAPQPQF